MKSKQLWIALVMILVSVSSYCQYPIIKKIKQDSVVIMTIEQGKEINALYLGYNNTIDSLKVKTKYYDSAINQISKKQDTINTYRFHIQNTKQPTGIDQEFKEKYEKTQDLNRFWIFLLFITLALIKTQ